MVAMEVIVMFREYPFTSEYAPLVIPQIVGECMNCGGGGFMYAFLKEGGPYRRPFNNTKQTLKYLDDGWYTGETHSDYCPVCSGNKREEFLLRNCGIEGGDLNLRLEKFKVEKRGFAEKAAAKEVATYVLSDGTTTHPNGFVTFWGEYGVGKTLLLKMLINGFRLCGKLACYISAADMLAEVRSTFGTDTPSETMIAFYRDVPVLCVDEVDRVNVTQWTQETLFRVLDWRHQHKGRLLTVLATNTNPTLMSESFQYLASRMSEGMVQEVGGVDVRPALGHLEQQKLEDFDPFEQAERQTR